ncbi:MAG: ATP-binding cassette domain-containing protein [Candidatus Pacearchaeota archaeon]
MNSITIKNLNKKFEIEVKPKNFLHKLKKKLIGKEIKREILVNKDVNIDIKHGEIIGIVGPNSAGKSTLFRLISKIYQPTNGFIEVNGKIVSLIGLKRGLREELSMIDNILFFGCLFGMTRKEMKKRLDSIIEGSKLESFSETKIKNFSEGMKERLILSIAFNTEFDILLLDEVFSSIDEEFLDKNFEVIRNFKKKNKTILITSHNLEIIKRYCDKVIWFDKGEIKKVSGIEIVEEYKNERK